MHRLVVCRHIPEPRCSERYRMRMPCNTPVDISVGNHIHVKRVNKLFRSVLVCRSVLPCPSLVDTGEHTRICVLALDGIIAHTECFLILERKACHIVISCKIPGIVIVYLVADNPVGNQSRCRVAVTLRKERHQCLNGFRTKLLVRIKRIVPVLPNTP